MEYIWFARIGFVLFSIGIDFFQFDNLYLRVIHDTAGHFIQSLFICTIYSFGKLDWIAFIPAVIASLIDIDHFYAARSFSIKSATKLQKQAPLHNLLLPLGLFALYTMMKRFIKSERLSTLAISLCICLVVHLYRDGIRRGVAIAQYRSEPIPYTAYIFYISTYTFCVEILMGLHESTNQQATDKIILP